jgi:hypothetical protein
MHRKVIFYFEDIGRAIEIERTKVQPAGDAVPGLEGLDAMVEHNKSALGAATTSGWEPSESWQSEFVGSYKRSLGDDVWQPGAKRGPGSGGGFSEHLHDSGSEFSGTFSADRSTASRGFGGGDDSISFIDATQNLFTHVRAYQRANARYHDPNERAEQQQYADARETALTAAIAVMTDTPRTVAKTRNDLEKEGNSNGVVTLEYFGTEMARRKQGTLNPPPAPPPQRGVGESVGRHAPVPQSRERIHRNSVWETEVFSQENCGEAGEEEIPIDPQLLGEGGGYPDPTIYQQQPSYPLSQGMQPVDSGFGMDGGSTTPYTPPQPYGGSNARSVWQPVTYTTSAITHTAEEQYPSGQYPSGTGSSSAAAGQFGGSGAESQGAPTHVAQQPSVYYYPETKTVGTLGSSGYPHSQSGGTSGPYYRQPFDEQQGSQPAASTSPFQGFSNAPTYREAPQGGFTPLQPMPPPPAPSSTTQQRASGRARPPQEGDAEERRPQHQQQRRYRR